MTNNPDQRSTKKQHYIPQFYLKNFSLDKNHVHVYDKAIGPIGSFRYQTTINVAHQNNFYTHRTKNGDNKNLEELFCIIEGRASTAIRNVLQNKAITEKERYDIAVFAGFQYTRTPYFKAKTEIGSQEVYEKSARMWAKMLTKDHVKEFFHKKGKDLTDEKIEDILDFGSNPKRSKIKVNVPREHWIKIMLNLGLDAAARFIEMDWIFAITNKPYAFITSDNPFLLFPPEQIDRFRGVGLLTPGARKFLPLSSNLCLIMGDTNIDPQVGFKEAQKDFYRNINKTLMAQSYRFCFGSDLGKLEKLVKEIKPYLIDNTPKIIVS